MSQIGKTVLPAKPLLRRLVPGLVLGFLVLIGLSLLGDLRQVGQLILAFDWRMFPLALCFTLFNYTLRFLKWHFYIRQIGIRSIAWPRSLRSGLTAMLRSVKSVLR